jgi:hypothetical protein
MISLKEKIDIRLQRIANVLLLNASFTNNIGLLNGKMGIAIFFYHYASYSGNKLYENYAGDLIDEIYKEINVSSSIDFATGLMGIGWGIEYLVRNCFLEADTDEVLMEIDNTVFRATLKTPVLITNQTDLFGFGLYYLARLNGCENDNDNLNTIIKKQMLTYLHDDCERLLTKEELFDFKVPQLTINQINSIVYFLIGVQRLKLFPVKLAKLEGYLPKYIMKKAENPKYEVERLALLQLLSRLSKNLIDKNLNSEYLRICKSMKVETYKELQTDDLILNGFIKSSWYSLLYPVSFQNMGLAEKAFAIADNEESWNQRLLQLNKDKLGLDNGMAGLGLAILNEMKK